MSSFLVRLIRHHRRRGLLTVMVSISANACIVHILTHDLHITLIATVTASAIGTIVFLTTTGHLRSLLIDAYTDTLTGLPTRAVADHLLSTTTLSNEKLTVAFADVDRLNSVNISGHAAGDAFLMSVAAYLQYAAGGHGSAIRIGGDEFIILTSAHPEDLRTALTTAPPQQVIITGTRTRPTVSVGIATSGSTNTYYALACADAAMHTAKATGGNQVLIYDVARDGIPLFLNTADKPAKQSPLENIGR